MTTPTPPPPLPTGSDAAGAIWIVLEHEDHDCPRIVGAFTSEALAQACVDARPSEEVIPPDPEYGFDELRIPIHHRIQRLVLDHVVNDDGTLTTTGAAEAGGGEG